MRKKCSKCKSSKDVKQFSKNATNVGGRDHYCKTCNRKRLHKYFQTAKGRAAMKRAANKRRK